MISRIAEQSFWTFRYLERGEIFTRMLFSLQMKGLDNQTLSSKKEAILLHLSDGAPLFSKLWQDKKEDSELVHQFLTWETLNPSSLLTMLTSARENARLIREILHEDIWLAINGLHLWLNKKETQNLYMNNRLSFFKYLLTVFQKLKGAFYNSSRRDDYYQMMELGFMLERANQISSMLQKFILEPFHSLHHATPTEDQLDKQFGLFNFLLNCFASAENYLQSEQDFTPTSFVKFFTQDHFSPYSMRFCLENCARNLLTLNHQEHENLSTTYIQITELLTFLSQLPFQHFLATDSFEEHRFISTSLNAINRSLQAYILSPQKIINATSL